MPVTERIRRQCQTLLRPAERIGYLIPTAAVGIGASTSTVECYVVVTDRRIAVIVGGMFRRGHPREVNIEYPRVTRLGPVEYTPAPTFHLGNRTYEIDDEYVPEVMAADAELDGPEALPEDPFPDM